MARAPTGAGRRAQRGAGGARRRRLRPAGLLRLRPPHPGARPAGRRRPPVHQLPHHRPLLPHPVVPPDRAEPPQQRHGTGGRAGHRLPRLRRHHPPGQRLPERDPRGPTGTPPTRSASGTWPPSSRATWPPPAGTGRWDGASSASTASSAGETHQFVPALVSDNHQVPPPRTPEEGYHLTEDLVDNAIGLVTDLRAIDADKPFFLYLCPGACHSPHQSPRGVDRPRTRGRFDQGLGRLAPADLRPPAGRRGAARRHRTLAPARLGAGLGLAVGGHPAALRPLHGGLRRLPGPHRPPAGPAGRLPGGAPATSTTPS